MVHVSVNSRHKWIHTHCNRRMSIKSLLYCCDFVCCVPAAYFDVSARTGKLLLHGRVTMHYNWNTELLESCVTYSMIVQPIPVSLCVCALLAAACIWYVGIDIIDCNVSLRCVVTAVATVHHIEWRLKVFFRMCVYTCKQLAILLHLMPYLQCAAVLASKNQ